MARSASWKVAWLFSPSLMLIKKKLGRSSSVKQRGLIFEKRPRPDRLHLVSKISAKTQHFRGGIISQYFSALFFRSLPLTK